MNDSAETKVKIKILPVIRTMPADLLTPLSVYLKLSKAGKCSFLLESVEGGESLARYSFIGVDPGMTVSGNASSVTISGESGDVTRSIPMFDFLRDHFAGHEVVSEFDLPAFIGGAIGYFGFNCAGWFEPSLQVTADDNEPDATLMFFRSVIAFDHAKQVVNIVSLVFDNPSDGGDAAKLHRQAGDRNDAIRRSLENDPV